MARVRGAENFSTVGMAAYYNASSWIDPQTDHVKNF